jgi:carboxylate-amine ligase
MGWPSDPASLCADGLRERFSRAGGFTIGVEEELLLVDPVNCGLAPVSEQLVSVLDDACRYRSELSAAQIEIVTPVARTVPEAVAHLAEGRRRAVDAAGGAVRLAGAGTHPFAEPWADISSGERFQRLVREHRFGARVGALAAGLHVHLGIPGADRTVAVFDALRGYMPEVAALAAAAPFFAGKDTGFASIRPKLADALPHQGVAPVAGSWERYAEMLRWGRDTGAFPDPSELWWECRLHLKLATVEVRAPDAQASIQDVEAVAAVVQALAIWLSHRHDAGEHLPAHPAWQIEENRWRAARDGVEAELIDLDRGGTVPARDRLSRLLDELEPLAGEVDAAAGIARARELCELPAAERHRQVASDGLPTLVRWLADRTESLII